ncbi:MAG: FMN-binding protein, partial [Planctomycetota bacterium]|nr:FMN-binding protein [Planctomycetota bacterium]
PTLSFPITMLATVLTIGLAFLNAESLPKKPSFQKALRELKIPPPWLDSVNVNFDTTRPWNKAWDHIEQLLFTAEPEDRKKAVKITWIYQKAGRAKVGYPATVYFLTGEYAWSLSEFLKTKDMNAVTYTRMAACYRHFGEFRKALDALARARGKLPGPPWGDFKKAQVMEAQGEVYSEMKDRTRARLAFKKAIQTYQACKLPKRNAYLIPRSVDRVKSRMALLDIASLKGRRMKNGTFSGSTLGYSDTITAHVTIGGGKITGIKLDHREKADLGAKHIIPKRIVSRQSLPVDTVTGATITSKGIESAVFSALKKSAGLSKD